MESEIQSRSLFKQAQEVTFSRKRNKRRHLDFFYQRQSSKNKLLPKTFGNFIDSKLNFDEYIKGVFDKYCK